MSPSCQSRRLAGVYSIVAVITVCSQGCALAIAGLAAGAGGVAYVRGEVERVYPVPIEVAQDAVLAALAELNLLVTHQAGDHLTGSIEVRMASGDHVKIALRSFGASTAINLRVNTFGDETMSLDIFSRIDRQIYQPGLQSVEPLPTLAPWDAR